MAADSVPWLPAYPGGDGGAQPHELGQQRPKIQTSLGLAATQGDGQGPGARPLRGAGAREGMRRNRNGLRSHRRRRRSQPRQSAMAESRLPQSKDDEGKRGKEHRVCAIEKASKGAPSGADGVTPGRWGGTPPAPWVKPPIATPIMRAPLGRVFRPRAFSGGSPAVRRHTGPRHASHGHLNFARHIRKASTRAVFTVVTK